MPAIFCNTKGRGLVGYPLGVWRGGAGSGGGIRSLLFLVAPRLFCVWRSIPSNKNYSATTTTTINNSNSNDDDDDDRERRTPTQRLNPPLAWSKSSPPSWLSPAVAITSAIPPPTSSTDTSNVPPPRSNTRISSSPPCGHHTVAGVNVRTGDVFFFLFTSKRRVL